MLPATRHPNINLATTPFRFDLRQSAATPHVAIFSAREHVQLLSDAKPKGTMPWEIIGPTFLVLMAVAFF
jgi:hypothetical protein